jgi:hypothetical protein
VKDPIITDLRTEPEPFDRLTQLTVKLTEVIEENPEFADIKGVVFLNDEKTAGIQIFGYSPPDMETQAMADLLIHMRAVFASVGKRFEVLTDRGVLFQPKEERDV